MIRKNKKKLAKTHHAIINSFKRQLSTQRYETSTTAHVVGISQTAVVAFRTTIPNRPSVITLFGCFRCLDFRIKDLLLYVYCDRSIQMFGITCQYGDHIGLFLFVIWVVVDIETQKTNIKAHPQLCIAFTDKVECSCHSRAGTA
jgi:hypothetical protein